MPQVRPIVGNGSDRMGVDPTVLASNPAILGAFKAYLHIVIPAEIIAATYDVDTDSFDDAALLASDEIPEEVLEALGLVVAAPIETATEVTTEEAEEELILNNSGGAEFSAAIGYCLIKTTIDGLDINGNILNEDPLFLDIEESDYNIDINSPAVDNGISTSVIFDINGDPRDGQPDIGAYENHQ